MFRFKGFEYVDEMRVLLEGISATRKDAWGPFREAIAWEEIGSSTTHQDKTLVEIPLDSGPPLTPPSPRNIGKLKERCKRSKGLDKDSRIQAVLEALAKLDGLTIKECNQVLDEMVSIEMHNPLYSVSSIIFCNSIAIRQQWMNLAKKSEEIRITRLTLTEKKLELMQ